MNFLMSKITEWLNKASSAIEVPEIPWHKFEEMMQVVNPYLSQANILFPVDAILLMLIIFAGIRVVLIVLWGLQFIRGMFPF